MKIDIENINLDDLFDQKYMHKEIKKGIFLSDNQCATLLKYKINPYECNSIEEILFYIDEILETDEDTEDLESVAKEISEFNYYANTNK